MNPTNAAELPIGSVVATGFRVAISVHSPGYNKVRLTSAATTYD